MPIFENSVVVELPRKVKVFLSLKAGVTRGDTPVHRQIEGKKSAEPKEKPTEQREAAENHLKHGPAQRSGAPAPGNVIHDGVVLPPKNMRPCGPKYKDDEFYLNSARKRAKILVNRVGLTTESSILDVGSGPGRVAIGILDQVGEIKRYCGVDVVERSTQWGWKNITSRHPNFQFFHIDVENRRYNPGVEQSDSDFVFPFGDEEFDVVTLYSVFTHMLTDGVRAYLKEFHRILRPEGRIHLTAFVEENVPDVEENPEGYLGREWEGDLYCVRYERNFFESLLDETGFKIDRFAQGRAKEEGEWGQRGVFVSKKS